MPAISLISVPFPMTLEIPKSQSKMSPCGNADVSSKFCGCEKDRKKMGQKNTQSVRRVRQFGFCFCPSECELRGKGARLTFKLACCPNLPSELNSQSGMGNAPPAEGSINKQGTTRTGNWLTHAQTRNKSCLSLQVMKTDGQTPLTRHGSIYKQKQKAFPKRPRLATDLLQKESY